LPGVADANAVIVDDPEATFQWLLTQQGNGTGHHPFERWVVVQFEISLFGISGG
jgi:hypothetical protein